MEENLWSVIAMRQNSEVVSPACAKCDVGSVLMSPPGSQLATKVDGRIQRKKSIRMRRKERGQEDTEEQKQQQEEEEEEMEKVESEYG